MLCKLCFVVSFNAWSKLILEGVGFLKLIWKLSCHHCLMTGMVSLAGRGSILHKWILEGFLILIWKEAPMQSLTGTAALASRDHASNKFKWIPEWFPLFPTGPKRNSSWPPEIPEVSLGSIMARSDSEWNPE